MNGRPCQHTGLSSVRRKFLLNNKGDLTHTFPRLDLVALCITPDMSGVYGVNVRHTMAYHGVFLCVLVHIFEDPF